MSTNTPAHKWRKRGEAWLAGKTKDALDVCLQRTRESRLCRVQAAGAGGKRKRNTKRAEWRDGGRGTVGDRRHEERWSGMKDRQGKGEGGGRAPRLHRVGTARAETKREDLSN